MSSQPARNPFRPSFGASPLHLAGRDDLVSSFSFGLLEGVGSPYRAVLLSGVRGVGKTVLLNELEDTGKAEGWVVLRCYPDDQLVDTLVHTSIPELLEQLNPTPRRRLSGGSIMGMGSVRTESNPEAHKRSPRPTLITRLRELTEELRPQGVGVLLTLDEVQAVKSTVIHELATAVQDLIRDQYDIAFVAAGLPHGVDELLQHEGTTFLRRAQRVDLHNVSVADTRAALLNTIEDSGRHIEADALEAAVILCHGYPYLIQVVGSLMWAVASRTGAQTIVSEHVRSIQDEVVKRMGQQVHRPALMTVPDGEMRLLRAMAELMEDVPSEKPSGNPGAADAEGITATVRMAPTAAIAHQLNIAPNGISARRSRLMRRDLICSPRFGYLAFTLPYLEEYILSH